MKLILKAVLSVLLLGVIFKYIKMEELIENLQVFSIRTILYSLIMFIMSWGILVYRWYLLLPEIRFSKLMAVSFIGYFYSLILPGQIAGEIVKTYRLSKGRLDAEKIAASVVVDKLVGFLGILMISTGGVIASHSNVPIEITLGIIASTILISVGLFCVNVTMIYALILTLIKLLIRQWPTFNNILLRVIKLLDAWRSYISQPIKLFYSFCLSAIFQFIFICIIIIFSYELNVGVSFADWCWIYGLASIAVLTPITFGGIGVREGVFVSVLSLQGVPLEKSIAISIAFFSISLIAVLVGAILEVTNRKL